jgi:hypothetical protein
MKNILKSLSVVMMFLILFASCSKEEEPIVTPNSTINPCGIIISVLDKDSVNILNDSITRAEYMQNMKIIYRDSVFSCSGETKRYDSKQLFNGKNSLSNIEFWTKDYYNTKWMPYTYYAFWFGTFYPDENLKDETIIIDWGNGDTDKITFSYTGALYEWLLNGERVRVPAFYIIK